ncbi:hypothetical protein POM88_032533 [Heracleum sosnowskyi]|uniref:Gag protein n=1 Tax=Heracleum sosnowskyi TaxID=360622 RepID=A0AAD8I0B9_9APIA|nr:hypothetical protein POM88_032533 [Heracleum sosnowskyi]
MKQGEQSVSEFYTQIKTVWDSLDDVTPLPTCTCDSCTCTLSGRIKKMQQDHRVLQFLMKLNDQFSMIRANILMASPLPDLNQVYRIVAQEESRKEFFQSAPQHSNLAFVADKRKFVDSSQYNKFSNLQNSANLQRQNYNVIPKKFNGKPANDYFCTHCKIAGHGIERCFKVHGYPPGFKSNREKRFAALSHSEESQQHTDKTDTSAPVTMQ